MTDSIPIQSLSTSLLTHARPGLRPKDVISAVRQDYPRVPKDQLVRAAFYAMLSVAESDMEKAALLHDFAMRERMRDD
jgi:hypothetical protein